MRISPRKVLSILGVVLAGGYVIAGPGTGCFSYSMETTLSSTNFCFIFDCQNGILGGTIDPCSDTGTGPVFVDCPNAQ